MQVVKHSIKRMTEELHEVRINGNALCLAKLRNPYSQKTQTC
jgi:hypothetical protein